MYKPFLFLASPKGDQRARQGELIPPAASLFYVLSTSKFFFTLKHRGNHECITQTLIMSNSTQLKVKQDLIVFPL